MNTKPFPISVLLFAYNHERFIEPALRSVLGQDHPGFELIVVDDASNDGTRAIIDQILAEPARPGIVVHKIFKERNGGLLTAVNDAMAMASGQIFIAMAGDDISLPDRLSRTLRHFEASAEVQLVYGEMIKIDEEGRHLSLPAPAGVTRRYSYHWAASSRIYASASPFGASAAYRRELFDFFGPMGMGTHGEDNCYWVRALMLGTIIHDSTCYIHWRQHGNNLSNFVAKRDCDAWRTRHLEWMEKHATMSPQWRKDIRVACQRGAIGRCLAWRLRWAGAREDARWALEASTMRADPWSVWGRRAIRMLCLGRVFSTIKLFKARCSSRRRDRLWHFWAKLRSNA